MIYIIKISFAAKNIPSLMLNIWPHIRLLHFSSIRSSVLLKFRINSYEMWNMQTFCDTPWNTHVQRMYVKNIVHCGNVQL